MNFNNPPPNAHPRGFPPPNVSQPSNNSFQQGNVVGGLISGGFTVPPPTTRPPPLMGGASVNKPMAPELTSPKNAQDGEEAQQAEMLVKVLNLTDEQIRMLPPEDRTRVIELRKQLRQQVFFQILFFWNFELIKLRLLKIIF